MKPSRKVISRFRSTLAFVLMLWCAGAGCLVVSYANGAAMSGADLADYHSNKQKLSGSSASMGAHACCKSRHSSPKRNTGEADKQTTEVFTGFQQVTLPEAPGPSGASSCCPLTSGSFVVASRSQSNDDNVSHADQRSSFSLILTNSQPAPRAYPLRLPDQNQTYLRDCVFLI